MIHNKIQYSNLPQSPKTSLARLVTKKKQLRSRWRRRSREGEGLHMLIEENKPRIQYIIKPRNGKEDLQEGKNRRKYEVNFEPH